MPRKPREYDLRPYGSHAGDAPPMTGGWQVRVLADGTTAEGVNFGDLLIAALLPFDEWWNDIPTFVPVDPETGEELR